MPKHHFSACATFGILYLLLPLTVAAAITKTELAGTPLSQYPFFEYVRAFNVNAPVNVAIDPTRFPAIVGHTCDIYVVNHKSASDWATNPTLTRFRRGHDPGEHRRSGTRIHVERQCGCRPRRAV
jgi:hypothetical protein